MNGSVGYIQGCTVQHTYSVEDVILCIPTVEWYIVRVP